MNYVIDPMWFYWLQVFQSLKVLLIIFSVLLASAGAIVLFVASEEWKEDERKKKIKPGVIYIIFAFVIMTAALLIPQKETMIQMKVAENVTYEKVEKVVEQVQETAKGIMKGFEDD